MHLRSFRAVRKLAHGEFPIDPPEDPQFSTPGIRSWTITVFFFRSRDNDSYKCFVIQEGFRFSEGTSAKWIFGVEIEKLRAEIFCRKI
jgi:hypothetical protein